MLKVLSIVMIVAWLFWGSYISKEDKPAVLPYIVGLFLMGFICYVWHLT